MDFTIGICGYYGKCNFGDEMVLDLIISHIKKTKINYIIYSDDAVDNIKNGINEDCLRCNMLVIGGGTIVNEDFWLFDKEKLNNLIKTQIPILFINISITPNIIESEFGQKLKLLNAEWFVRDMASINHLKKLNIESSFLPDIMFNIKNDCKFKSNHKYACVYLNHYPMVHLHGNNSREFLRAHHILDEIVLFCEYLIENNYFIYFMSAQVSEHIDDRVPGLLAFHKMKDKNKCKFYEKLTWEKHVELIGKSNFVLSMRYHSTLCASHFKIPFIDMRHHDKNKNFLIDNNLMENSNDYYTTNVEQLINRFEHLSKHQIDSKSHMYLWNQFDVFWNNKIKDIKNEIKK